MAKTSVTSTDGTRSPRTLSIDLLRGLDVWLMLFVNEMAGVKATPPILRHVSATADGMTIPDVVFPAFLFIVGLAMPFAFAGRRRRGESNAALWRHVLGRTLALLVMGVLMVNAEEASRTAPLPPVLWNLLMTVAVVLIWGAPEGVGPTRRRALRYAGVVLLAVLVFLFRADHLSGLIQIRPMWWGILGLIGWAYLVAAALYLLIGDRPAGLAAGIVALYGVYFADEIHQAFAALAPIVDVGRALGSHAAITLAGVLLGVWILQRRGDPRALLGRALGFAAVMAVSAALLHTRHGLHHAFSINKIRATAPWCLYCSALTAAVWALLYFLVDVKGARRWPPSIAMAGENALLAYLVPPVLLGLFEWSATLFGRNYYGDLGGTALWIGTVRSILFAWAVIRLCGLLRRRGLRLQL
jgi:predicted acyltransferase